MKNKLIIIIMILMCFLGIKIDAQEINYTDIRDLPETSGSYTTQLMNDPGEVAPVEFEKRILNKSDGTTVNYYYLTIYHENGTVYYSKTNLPVEETAVNFNGYYYTEKDDTGRINRFLYYNIKPEKYTDSYLVNEVSMIDYDTQVNPFGRVIWNITTGTYNVIDQITIFGAYRSAWISNKKAYFLDFVLSIPTDTVRMVHLNYNYRNIYWFGNRGKWYNETFVYRDTDYLKGFDSEGKPITTTDEYVVNELREKYAWAEKNGYITAFGDETTYNDFVKLQPMIDIKSDPQAGGLEAYNAVQFQTDFINRLNNQARQEYEYAVDDPNWRGIEHMNEAVKRWFLYGNFNFNDVFSSSSDGKIYTLPLQAVRDYLFATGKEFRDMNFIDVVYEKDGKLYHVSESQILNVIPGYISAPPLTNRINDWLEKLFDNFASFWKKAKWYVIGGLIIVGIGIIVYIATPILRAGSQVTADKIKDKSKQKKKK